VQIGDFDSAGVPLACLFSGTLSANCLIDLSMTTRRDFLRIASETSAFTFLANRSIEPVNLLPTQTTTPSRTLLELQQRFVDLRFGMFLHFNMATFQDREWGDPTAAPSLFHPTALDTDQWAAAAKSAEMTWGCLTMRHHDGFCL
jgi:alpha-L-fucosidase